MNNKFSIDFSEERLLDMASDMIDDHNYMGALKMLNKNAEINFDSESSYEMYAEIFDDLALYEKSINYWFRFIDCARFGDLSEAYEGLAVNYMNLGDDRTAAFYYNKMLAENGDLNPETQKEVIDTFLSKQEQPLRITWPPKLADYTPEMQQGIDMMRAGQFDKAIEYFDEVQPGNDKYDAARNYIAMCNIISDKYDEAEQECNQILERDPKNVQALSTLSAVKNEQHKTEESRAIAQRLVGLKVTSSEDLYKSATVCCENKMHREAHHIFNKLQYELDGDCNILFFAAVAAWNCGEKQASFDTFDRLLTLYPHAFTARYYSEYVRDLDREGKTEELEYFYRMPQSDREDMLSYLAAYASLPARAAKKQEHIENVAECVEWAFDEGDHREMPELQYLAATCAVKAGLDGMIRDLLIAAFYPDPLKVHLLAELCENDSVEDYGVVVCNVYKQIQCYPVKVGRAKRTAFKRAYAHLFSRFSVMDQRFVQPIKVATETLYVEMTERGTLKLSEDLHALTAAIFVKSGITDAGVTRENVCTFFGAEKESVEEILGETL
jgi:hypothetical protein